MFKKIWKIKTLREMQIRLVCKIKMCWLNIFPSRTFWNPLIRCMGSSTTCWNGEQASLTHPVRAHFWSFEQELMFIPCFLLPFKVCFCSILLTLVPSDANLSPHINQLPGVALGICIV